MRIIDRYILKTFFVPFLATFLVVLFVLVMQFLWQTFENIAGKGVSFPFLLKFLYYTTLFIIPQALPIGVLLSSIMALGNLGENYEFAAAKSVGISLYRLLRPLIILAFMLSIVNFLFLNNVYPYAVLKQKNLYLNIKKKKPALALIPGSFNNDLPGYQIKFDEKYGENENLLKKILIYDLSNGKGNQKVITAERGKIISDEGSRYMTFVLNNGNYYEEHIKFTKSYARKKRMTASSATFKEYKFNIDISSVSGDEGLATERYTKNYMMLNLKQLKDTIPDLKARYDEVLNLRSKYIYTSIKAEKLYKYSDSIKAKNIDINILNNFKLEDRQNILNTASVRAERVLNSINNNKSLIKLRRKMLNLFDTEYYNRVSFSLSCLILFFIGAPLGSIIRKGGFGLPMILSVIVYVTYFFINTFGKNLAEESSVSAVLGSWIAALVVIPIGILLTRRVAKDKKVFNINISFENASNFFKKLHNKIFK